MSFGNGRAASRKLIHKICAWCEQPYTHRPYGKRVNEKRRFCTQSCSAKWRMSQPEAREKARLIGKQFGNRQLGSHMKEITRQRMITNNPMSHPETLEKMRKSMQGRTFVARGGNGQLTIPQIRLASALQLPTEYPIQTRPVKGLFLSMPNSYKVDLADPARKLAIEVDGKMHLLKKVKLRDEH